MKKIKECGILHTWDDGKRFILAAHTVFMWWRREGTGARGERLNEDGGGRKMEQKVMRRTETRSKDPGNNGDVAIE